MRDRVLISGGCGFIGHIVAKRCVAEGRYVRVYDIEGPVWALNDVEYVKGDISDNNKLALAMTGCSAVYHLASHLPVSRGRIRSSESKMEEVNVNGTRNILATALSHGVRKVICVSSTAVYGVPKEIPITDSSPLNPIEGYGRSKMQAEELCRQFAGDGGDVVVIRPCPVIGEGRLGVFQMLFEWIYKGYNVPILGRGDTILQFVHVDDCADAIMAAGALPLHEGRFAAYNIGVDDARPIRKALEMLISHVGSRSKVRSLPKRPIVRSALIMARMGLLPVTPFHVMTYGESIFASTATARRDLKWIPKYGYVEMLVRGYEWYCANREDVLGRSAGSAHQLAPNPGLMSLVRWIP